jgi:hypothetical protein
MKRGYFPKYNLPVLGNLRSVCFREVETKHLDIILTNSKLYIVNYKSRRVPTSGAVLSEVHSLCDQRSKKQQQRWRMENWQFRAAIDNSEGFGEDWKLSF